MEEKEDYIVNIGRVDPLFCYVERVRSHNEFPLYGYDSFSVGS